MTETHYKEKLSAFVNHELTNDERQTIAGHLLLCSECRAEHDEIKLGAALANRLAQRDAPENLWNKIETALDAKETKVSAIPAFAFFDLRIFAACLLAFFVLSAAVYFAFLRKSAPETVKNDVQKIENSQIVSESNRIVSNQSQNAENKTIESNISNKNPLNSVLPDSKETQNQIKKLKKIPESQPLKTKKDSKPDSPAKPNSASWAVETLAGTVKIGNSFESEKLSVGEFLETDENSKAKIQVANIGNVEIAPNSRVKLVNTRATEHRLALEKGALKAKIFAPPRLFIVDTPSAAAVDLGCEYTLEVDEKGDSRLHVTGGFVALENGKFSAIVPAGAIALTKKGKGIGTPFAEDSSAELQSALYQFDFADGGNAALETIIKEANVYDSLTLWHLLVRVPKAEREKVFNALANFVEPPANVTVEGILRLDKKMLDAWWTEVETVWFG